MRRDEAEALAGVEFLVLLIQIGGDAPHFSFGLLDSDARVELSQYLKIACSPLNFHPAFGIKRPEKVQFPTEEGKIEVRRSDADDDFLFPVEHDPPSDDVRTRAQSPLPQAVTDDDRLRAGLFIVGRKGSAES